MARSQQPPHLIMDALKRKMEIAAVAFFCTVTALIAAYSCATTAAANLAQQTAAAPATEYVTLAYIQIAQQQPQNDMDSDIKLTLPAGTDIRLNDKIVSSETGLEYTAGQPRNIRGHHMTVKIYRTAQQRPL